MAQLGSTHTSQVNDREDDLVFQDAVQVTSCHGREGRNVATKCNSETRRQGLRIKDTAAGAYIKGDKTAGT